MKIELRNIKYFAAGSEETSCFVATIYVDGQKAGDAKNDGHGGSTVIFPHSLRQQIDAYARTLPNKPTEYKDVWPNGMPQDAETIVDDLLHEHLVTKDLQRLMAKRLVYTVADEPGKLYQSKALPTATLKILIGTSEALASTTAKLKAERILNALPLDQALALYREAA